MSLRYDVMFIQHLMPFVHKACLFVRVCVNLSSFCGVVVVVVVLYEVYERVERGPCGSRFSSTVHRQRFSF